jgi:hypothetical protein
MSDIYSSRIKQKKRRPKQSDISPFRFSRHIKQNKNTIENNKISVLYIKKTRQFAF